MRNLEVSVEDLYILEDEIIRQLDSKCTDQKVMLRLARMISNAMQERRAIVRAHNYLFGGSDEH